MKSGEREGAVACSFFWSQPKLNYGVLEPDPNHPWELPFDHADIRALWADMFGIIRYWLALGVDGFRTDSARRICPDHPPLGNVARFPKEYLPYYRNRHGGLIAIPTGNHDYMRAATERSTVMVRALFGAVLTIPCLPFIYYGDEIGMPFLSGLTSKEGGYRVTGARRLRRDDTIDLDESGWLILALSRAAKAAGKRRFRRVPKQCVAPHSKGRPQVVGR